MVLRESRKRNDPPGSADRGSKVDSWVSPGPNQPVEPQEVEAALDDETLSSLSQQTGLLREELVARIARDLPEAVDKMTPNGELPSEQPMPWNPDEPNLLDDLTVSLLRARLIELDLPIAITVGEPI
jgi:YidB-like protein